MSWLDWLKRKSVDARREDLPRATEPDARQAHGGGTPAAGAPGGGDAATAPELDGTAEQIIAEGQLRDRRGDLHGAVAAYSKAIERSPSALAYYGRGLARCKLKRYPRAIADLDRALALRPRFVAALTERGLAYVDSEQIERGLADYDAAIAIEPAHATAHGNKGLACIASKRWPEALASLDIAIRLNPGDAYSRYARGIAHEMLGDVPRAVRDFQRSIRIARTGPHLPHAETRLRALRARVGRTAPPAEPDPADLWPVLTGVSLDDTVGDLLRKLHAERAFFARIDPPDGGATFVDIHGRRGLKARLTPIADAIGPRILDLKLGQLRDLIAPPGASAPADPDPPPAQDAGRVRLIEGSRIHVIKQGDRLLGVFSEGISPEDHDLPTALFADPPIFGRSDEAADARRCASCERAVAYFTAAIDDDGLAGYACPHCSASPVTGWVEERMRPGRWSQTGFLGATEALREVIARDARTLVRLGTGHAQIADALDHLITAAFAASAERVARAVTQFEDELVASGQRGLAGLAVLPLGASLDELEARLRTGEPMSRDRGIAVGDHDVYLELYVDYQHCPFTQLFRPWSDELPGKVILRRSVGDHTIATVPTDRSLPCQHELSYRHANLDFLIVRRASGQALRGAGLLVHLIRDHEFFEGDHSRHRLDPEQVAKLLGLA